MPLHTPSAWTFWLSVALALLAVEAGDNSAFGSVCGLDWPCGLPCSCGWLHCQDEVKWSREAIASAQNGRAYLSITYWLFLIARHDRQRASSS